MKTNMHRYFEFFAGGGMARAGLGANWECLFANDFDSMKAAAYTANWGGNHLVCEDVARVRADQLPGRPDMVWASFPCQDLSLAGNCLGLGSASSSTHTRSGTFWPFWGLMRTLRAEERAPRMIVLENVYGVLTSRAGKDFAAICSALSGSNYRFGAVVVDAQRFLPQSRQRVFFVAVEGSSVVPEHLQCSGPVKPWHPAAMHRAYTQLSPNAKRNWIWWNVREPKAEVPSLIDLIEDQPTGVDWHPPEQTRQLLEMMTPVNRQKIAEAQLSGARAVGTLYKRTRVDAHGIKHQRAEVRFDGVAGCLRTPAGGSSRQIIIVVNGQSIRSRLLSPREAARLMGLPDTYVLPPRYNDAYKIAGDGVCVNVVRHLAACVLEPVLKCNAPTQQELLMC